MSDILINQIRVFFDEYSISVSPVTAKRVKYQLNTFIGWLDENHIDSISNNTLYAFFEYISHKYKAGVYNLYVFMINGFIKRFYIELDLYASIPVETDVKHTDLLTYDMYLSLLDTSKSLGMFEVSHYIIKFIYHTGIRIGELKFLTVENYHRRQYDIFFKGRNRTIYISNYLYDYLQKYYLKYKPRTYFFYSGKNWENPYSVTYFQNQLKNIGFYAEVPLESCHPHALRHLFAHEYLKIDNSSLEELSILMGHKNITTTSVYLRGYKNSLIDNLNSIRK